MWARMAAQWWKRRGCMYSAVTVMVIMPGHGVTGERRAAGGTDRQDNQESMKLTLRIPQMAAGAAVLLAIALMAQPCQAHEENQRRFATPEEAITALQAAAKTGDKAAMDQIFGRHIRQLMTGDEVQDKTNFESFSRAVD